LQNGGTETMPWIFSQVKFGHVLIRLRQLQSLDSTDQSRDSSLMVSSLTLRDCQSATCPFDAKYSMLTWPAWVFYFNEESPRFVEGPLKGSLELLGMLQKIMKETCRAAGEI
jgi:hypothetical protein